MLLPYFGLLFKFLSRLGLICAFSFASTILSLVELTFNGMLVKCLGIGRSGEIGRRATFRA